MADSGYLWGIQSTFEAAAIRPSLQVQSTESGNAARMLTSLRAGQTIEGKVVNVGTDGSGQRTALIDLGNNTTVTARLSGELTLSQGQTVSFQVRSNMNGTINLNPLYQNTAADSMALRALASAGISSDASTLQMVKDMMQSGLNIDRDSLIAMNNARQDFPDVSMTTLTGMRSLDLPVTAENIQQYTNYQNYQHQIVNSVNEIMSALPEAFVTMQSMGHGAQALDMYSNLVQMFATFEQPLTDPTHLIASAATESAEILGDVTQDLPGSPEKDPGTGETLAQTKDEAAQSAAQTAEGTPAAGTPILEGAAGRTVSAPLAEGGAIVREGAGEPALQTTEGKGASSADKAALSEGGEGGAAGTTDLTSASTSAATANASTGVSAHVTVTGNGTLVMLSENFLNTAKDLGMPENILARLNGQSAGGDPVTSQELLKTLGEMYEHSSHLSPEIDKSWANLFSSKDFTGIVQDAISKQWLLRPQDVESPENISQLYQRLHAQTKALTQILSGSLGSDTPLSQNVSNLSNNIDFMNQINQMYQYVQLPLRLQDQNAHGDLYVYTNKKNLARNDGSVSAILHLDMDHLGPLDVYVKMRDNKVNTNFYLADDAALDLIHEHIDELDARLEKRGYSMEAKMMLQDEKTQDDLAADEMLKINPSAVNMISHTAFDARA